MRARNQTKYRHIVDAGPHKHRLSVFSVFAVLCATLFIMPSTGYALTYTAHSHVAFNELCTDYFTIGLYADEDCTIQTTSFLTTSDIFYTLSNGVCTITTISIGNDSMYLKIDNTNHTESNPVSGGPYLITATASCNISGVSASETLIDVIIGDEGLVRTNTVGSEIRLNAGVYKIDLDVVSIQASGLDSSPSNMEITLSINAENTSISNYLKTQTKSIVATSDVIIIDTDTTDQTIQQVNIGNPSFDSEDPDYEFQDSVQEYTSSGQDIYVVQISAVDNPNHGISDDGDVNLRVVIPSNVLFCIRCHTDTGGNGSRLQVNITIDGVTKWCRFIYSNSFSSGYIFNNNSSNTFSPTLYASTSYPTLIERDLNNSGYWMVGEIVEIQIFDYNNTNNIPDNMMLDIIFWPTE